MEKLDPEISQKEEADIADSQQSFEWTEQEERRMRLKLDLRIVPTVCILFLLCYIDRTNIG
jgi:hypothetical protein